MQRAEFLKKLPTDKDSIHCIGIGGIGVSALAELLHEGGFQVSGSDAEYNDICRYLADVGVQVAPAGHREENVPDNCGAGIMTAAASITNPEASKLLRNGAMTWSRGEFLAELCRCYQRPVMVAGSHGKSSTSAMLGWILQQLAVNAGLLIGARYNSNDRNARLGDGDILLAEADESDGTHALLTGELALITNIDGDHAWNDSELKKQEQQFIVFARSFRKTLYVAGEGTSRILANCANAEAIPSEKFQYLCSLVPDNMLGYERSNAALALAGAEYLQLDLAKAAAALKSYPGIKRRQMVSAVSADKHIMVLEDYAHHPRELACSLEVIKMRYPQYSLTVVFQPHRYRRLLHYFNDFVRVLSDKNMMVKVLPVFCAWEQPLLDGKESIDLVEAVNNAGGKAELLRLDNVERTAAELIGNAAQQSENVLFAMIGAGDIDRLSKALAAAVNS